MAADRSEGSYDDPGTRWNSFSNYGDIADDVHDAVIGAIEAQTIIHGRHQEGARVSPELAADASAQIMGAAKRLLTELRREGEKEESYQEMLDDWEGEDGYISKLAEARLTESSPAFLHDFVEDIHRAAFEIGYLRAGREEPQDIDDAVENDARSMFEEP